jgi:hypothetical protein
LQSQQAIQANDIDDAMGFLGSSAAESLAGFCCHVPAAPITTKPHCLSERECNLDGLSLPLHTHTMTDLDQEWALIFHGKKEPLPPKPLGGFYDEEIDESAVLTAPVLVVEAEVEKVSENQHPVAKAAHESIESKSRSNEGVRRGRPCTMDSGAFLWRLRMLLDEQWSCSDEAPSLLSASPFSWAIHGDEFSVVSRDSLYCEQQPLWAGLGLPNYQLFAKTLLNLGFEAEESQERWRWNWRLVR